MLNNNKTDYHFIVVFNTDHTNYVGNACIIDLISFLANSFKISIITNKSTFIKYVLKDCNIIPVNITRKNSSRLFSNLLYWKKLADIIKNHYSDAVFLMHEDAPLISFIDRPAFVYIHQFGQRTSLKQNILKRIIKNSLRIIYEKIISKSLSKSRMNFAVSQSIINYFNEKHVNNIILTPHAVKLDLFKCPYLSNDHKQLKLLKDNNFFLVTYTGWINEARGFKILLDSISSLNKIDYKIILVMVGADKDYYHKIESFKVENNLVNNIINYGIIEARLIPGILYYSDICISLLEDLPAHHLSPPQKIIEYFAAGKPVICNNITPHKNLVNHAVTGFLIDYDSFQLSEAILKLKRDKDLLCKMSINASNESSKYDQNIIYTNMVSEIKRELLKF